MKKISIAVLLTTSIFAGSTIAADNLPGSTIDGAMAGSTGKGTSADNRGISYGNTGK